jgi:hypothetical protein
MLRKQLYGTHDFKYTKSTARKHSPPHKQLVERAAVQCACPHFTAAASTFQPHARSEIQCSIHSFTHCSSIGGSGSTYFLQVGRSLLVQLRLPMALMPVLRFLRHGDRISDSLSHDTYSFYSCVLPYARRYLQRHMRRACSAHRLEKRCRAASEHFDRCVPSPSDAASSAIRCHCSVLAMLWAS